LSSCDSSQIDANHPTRDCATVMPTTQEIKGLLDRLDEVVADTLED
jgi:hypothetical protein